MISSSARITTGMAIMANVPITIIALTTRATPETESPPMASAVEAKARPNRPVIITVPIPRSATASITAVLPRVRVPRVHTVPVAVSTTATRVQSTKGVK